MQIKVDDATKVILHELAGGERKVGAYLDRIAPRLAAAQERIDRVEREAVEKALASVLVEAGEGET